MSTYRIDEGSLWWPDAWHDASVTIFQTSREGSAEASFVVSREPRTADETIQAYAARQLEAIAAQLPEFKLAARDAVTVDREPAVQLEFTWQSAIGAMRQVQVFVYHQQVALSLTGSARDATFARHETSLRRMLAGLRFQR